MTKVPDEKELHVIHQMSRIGIKETWSVLRVRRKGSHNGNPSPPEANGASQCSAAPPSGPVGQLIKQITSVCRQAATVACLLVPYAGGCVFDGLSNSSCPLAS
ncbi:hypothetical protein MRX96_041022 [Rhipicephalus microplus]